MAYKENINHMGHEQRIAEGFMAPGELPAEPAPANPNQHWVKIAGEWVHVPNAEAAAKFAAMGKPVHQGAEAPAA